MKLILLSECFLSLLVCIFLELSVVCSFLSTFELFPEFCFFADYVNCWKRIFWSVKFNFKMFQIEKFKVELQAFDIKTALFSRHAKTSIIWFFVLLCIWNKDQNWIWSALWTRGFDWWFSLDFLNFNKNFLMKGNCKTK